MRAAGGGHLVRLAAGFQVDDEHAELLAAWEGEGYVQPVAQFVYGVGFDVQGGDVGVLGDGDRVADGDADALGDRLGDGEDGVVGGVEQGLRGRGAVDFLEGDDVGVELAGVGGEAGEVVGRAGVDVTREVGFGVGSGG